MLDLDYGSDSDSSETETFVTPRAPSPPPKPTSGLFSLLPKPKKGKDKDANANPDAPKKIVVNLPKFDDVEEDRPAKKARTGGGISGLSAMLPAPKRKAPVGAPPPPPSIEEPVHEPVMKEDKELPKIEATSKANTAFIPQSLARKPIQPMSAFKKKKGTTGAGASAASAGATKKVESPKPQVSLFGSVSTVASAPKRKKTVPTGEYKPIMLEAAQPMKKPADDTEYLEEDPNFGQTSQAYSGQSMAEEPQDLHQLVEHAGLDENAMRQLYGRHGRGSESIKFTTFSVDDEYRQNERDRESGLAQEVKPVRTVAPGRHQLQSLLNIAQSQKGALEDSFARGKSNRKESASKYGW
ncbi:Similar to Cell cycle control protein cwf20; acc. no. Q9USK4 [Pyronema omphalodes CBS 100304]|uniref:Similar to Cell cycle control protein cwf20 acc. no. Q9USK4 n=1 Tax=Pyronema omphalodes (strain CBS 100304) TaxID=1076935 RepID=U4L0Y8_PYROM|nr:Similar to Cell cycle control protein cwf20; acc. no. Q9USK4 [Pyronema omphalodes CBS 100304]